MGSKCKLLVLIWKSSEQLRKVRVCACLDAIAGVWGTPSCHISVIIAINISTVSSAMFRIIFTVPFHFSESSEAKLC